MYIFYIPPLRNVLSVNINDSMIIRDSPGGEGVANISAKMVDTGTFRTSLRLWKELQKHAFNLYIISQLCKIQGCNKNYERLHESKGTEVTALTMS